MAGGRGSSPATTPAYPSFRPAWWLPGRHAQTLWAAACRRPPAVRVQRERLDLPDGDVLDLDWCGDGDRLMILVPGLEGSLRSAYARGLLARFARDGWRAVLLNHRGCGGEPNRFAHSYHSGHTADLAYIVDLLRRRHPERAITAVGVSLGGNILLKWLGETGVANPLAAAAAVSAPVDLAPCAAALSRGFARVYQWHLVRSLRLTAARKIDLLARAIDLDALTLRTLRSFRAFDDRITARLHGFAGVDDYYARASSRPWLRAITVPTLIVAAQDDPFLPPDALPTPADCSPTVELALTARGGHVGHVAGDWPWRARYWLEDRVSAFFAGHC